MDFDLPPTFAVCSLPRPLSEPRSPSIAQNPGLNAMAAARVVLCTTALLLLVGFAHAQPLEVVLLIPKTFEHETQAATGQTTG